MADAFSRHELSRQILLTLSKLLPAFGLIGTLVGMVLLLRDLYTQDVQSLPAALSLAVLTTLYGAVFANVVVAPLAARLHATATEREMRMGLTFDWVMMLVRGDVAAAVAQGVAARVPPRRLSPPLETSAGYRFRHRRSVNAHDIPLSFTAIPQSARPAIPTGRRGARTCK